MINCKIKIINNICYTELVYQRINKKLSKNYSKQEIEGILMNVIKKTDVKFFQKIGKNFYVSNEENKLRITINSNTFRVITVDKLKDF